MVWQGVYLAIIEIASYILGFFLEKGTLTGIMNGEHCANAMAMAFLTVNFAEMMCAINMRSQKGSLFSKGMFKNMNWWLVGSFFATTALTLVAIYVPGLRDVFGIHEVSFQWSANGFDLEELTISAALALSTIPVFEIGKAIHRLVDKKKNKD